MTPNSLFFERHVGALCSLLGLDEHVTFHGFMPHADIRPWFEGADILVMSSRHEGVPVAALEAAVAGIPTVGTAVGLGVGVGVVMVCSAGSGRSAGVGQDEQQLRLAGGLAGDGHHPPLTGPVLDDRGDR